MSKPKRLMELMLVVNRKRKFTVKELADEFDVSTRTIMRDLQELSELGVPLYSEFGPHGGFRVLGETNLPSISFNDDEAAAIFFAVYALRHNIDFQYKTEFFTALNKFYNMMPEDVRNLCRKMSQEAEHSANGQKNN